MSAATGTIQPAQLNGLRDLWIFTKPARRLEGLRQVSARGDVVSATTLGRRFFLVNDPELIRQILVEHIDDFHRVRTGGGWSNKADEAAMASDRLAHKRMRRAMQPGLHPNRLAAYGDTIVAYTEAAIDSWIQAGEIELQEAFGRLTLRIAARTLLSADVDQSSDRIGEAVTLGMEYLSGGSRLPVWVPTPRHLRLMRAYLTLDRTIKTIIRERRAAPPDQAHTDILADLLAANAADEGSPESRLSDREVYEAAMALLIAGHETTASTLTWLTWLLLGHPGALARAQDDADALPAVTAQTAARAHVIDDTIREAMRLYPAAWVLVRAVRHDAVIGSYALPKSSQVFMSPYLIQRDPRYYPEPARFLPERWGGGSAEPLSKRLPRFAFFPFGGGIHVCAGQFFAWQEMQMVLSLVLRRCHFELLTPGDIEPLPLITLRPGSPIRVRVSRSG